MPGKKLLVADDSLTIQKVIRLALSNEGYEIQTVADGNDAIQQLTLFQPDVVLIDVSLPGKNAFVVKREVNQHSDFEEIRFVLMSSAFEKVDELEASEVGFHGRLTKPFDPAHLRQTLTDVLDQVVAKRMEKTSLLKMPSLGQGVLPPLPPFEVEVQDGQRSDPPLQPDDLPILPSVSTESVKNLWEPSESLPALEEKDSLPGFPGESLPPLPGASVSGEPEGGEQDIKFLTESTIRMTGLEDFQWSVTEPSLKPLPHLLEDEDHSFLMEPKLTSSISKAKAAPPVPHRGKEDSVLQGGGGPFRAETRSPTSDPIFQYPGLQPQVEQASLPEFRMPPPPSVTRSGAVAEMSQEGSLGREFVSREDHKSPSASSVEVAAVSQEEIEKIVRQEVQQSLAKLTQSLLPDIAERLIKEEIHKLLSQ